MLMRLSEVCYLRSMYRLLTLHASRLQLYISSQAYIMKPFVVIGAIRWTWVI